MLERARRLIFPDQCLLCGEMVEDEGALCPKCWRETPFTLGLCCDLCGAPLLGDAAEGVTHCDECRARGRPWQKGRAVMLYEGGARRLVLALKHGDRAELAPALAGWMASRAGPLIAEDTVIAPVPLHWRRLFTRRYNQSALLAAHVARRIGRPVCPDLLRRLRRTPPQDGMGVEARFENIAGAISVAPRHAERIEGHPVLLIDDVMTSGATLAACSEACLAAEASRVCVLVLARVARNA